MRENIGLYRGKRVNDDKWIYGYYVLDESEQDKNGPVGYIYCLNEHPCGYSMLNHEVDIETVSRDTGMIEFVMTDESVCGKLFEGDIVEVWGWRRPKYDNPRSQYDGDFKVRATIHFQNGAWMLDYDNEYNHSLEKLHGKEVDDRLVNGKHELYDYGYQGANEDWFREHNSRHKWRDIVKIGNIHDNPELLEETK